MPHLGQLPGASDSTPGHIGQKYLAFDFAGETAAWVSQHAAFASGCACLRNFWRQPSLQK
jgi:hypothetical protein